MCYKKCEPFLTTLTAEAERADVIKQAKIEALGIDLLEVKTAKEKESDDKVLNIIKYVAELNAEVMRRTGRRV